MLTEQERDVITMVRDNLQHVAMHPPYVMAQAAALSGLLVADQRARTRADARRLRARKCAPAATELHVYTSPRNLA